MQHIKVHVKTGNNNCINFFLHKAIKDILHVFGVTKYPHKSINNGIWKEYIKSIIALPTSTPFTILEAT